MHFSHPDSAGVVDIRLPEMWGLRCAVNWLLRGSRPQPKIEFPGCPHPRCLRSALSRRTELSCRSRSPRTWADRYRASHNYSPSQPRSRQRNRRLYLFTSEGCPCVRDPLTPSHRCCSERCWKAVGGPSPSCRYLPCLKSQSHRDALCRSP